MQILRLPTLLIAFLANVLTLESLNNLKRVSLDGRGPDEHSKGHERQVAGRLGPESVPRGGKSVTMCRRAQVRHTLLWC